MPRRERDFQTIMKGSQNFAKAVESARAAAKLLLQEANVARSALQDNYSSKNISAIENLAMVVIQSTAAGEERIRTIEERAKKDDEFFR